MFPPVICVFFLFFFKNWWLVWNQGWSWGECPIILRSWGSASLLNAEEELWKFVCAPFYFLTEFSLSLWALHSVKLQSARPRLMDLSVCVFVSVCSVITRAALLRQGGHVKSFNHVHLKLKHFVLILFVCVNNLPSGATASFQSRLSHRCDCCCDDGNETQTRWV